MDFRRLSKIPLPQGSLNGTNPINLTDIPNNILDALVPGYSLVSKYVLTTLGIDISLFVSIGVIFLALTKGGQYVYSRVSRAFRYLFISSVYIDETDDLFDMLMDWLAATYSTSSRRSAWAKTQRGSKVSDDLDDAADDALDSDGMFDYNRWSARTPPRYEPYYGRHVLWNQGRPFLFHRSQKMSAGQNLNVRFGNHSEDDMIQLDCLGRSVEPIREMLRVVKIWSLQKQRHTTTIRHPTPKDRARFSGSWSKAFSRPSRPMNTVILDSEQKTMIINDMNEYLHPSSPKWYAQRGIPYRRGYLFHGPPGTGKTSLSFALAGIFGLEIYVISLQDPELTEGNLMLLFNALPKRCILLLEDVDAAGLIRSGKPEPDNADTRAKWAKTKPASKDADTEKEKSNNGETKPTQTNESSQQQNSAEDYTLKDLVKELKSVNSSPRGGGGSAERAQGNSSKPPGTGITLSGLLNAIDGVASHEGRVLIMTTNHPENLDAALVRPGRVDRRVEFTMAAKEQIRELFYRMYVSDDDQSSNELFLEGKANGSVHESTNGHPPEKVLNGDIKHRANDEKQGGTDKTSLQDLASNFANRVPGHTYTPAEIQNHLLKYKKQPVLAFEKTDEWMKEIRAEKEKERKLLEEKPRDEEEEE